MLFEVYISNVHIKIHTKYILQSLLFYLSNVFQSKGWKSVTIFIIDTTKNYLFSNIQDKDKITCSEPLSFKALKEDTGQQLKFCLTDSILSKRGSWSPQMAMKTLRNCLPFSLQKPFKNNLCRNLHLHFSLVQNNNENIEAMVLQSSVS